MRRTLALVALLVGCTRHDGLRNQTLALEVSPVIDFGTMFTGGAKDAALELHSGSSVDLFVTAIATDRVDVATVDVALPLRVAPRSTLVVTLRWTPEVAETLLGSVSVQSSAGTQLTNLIGEALERPLCEDDNPCADTSLDLDTGTCQSVPREGPCDDQNACTENDSCNAGTCVGTGVTCVADSPCSVAACDAQAGCVNLPNPEACDDGNPCTVDSCDPTGCAHEALAGYQPCPGVAMTCAALPLCVAGACVSFTAPDGWPCNDESLCTLDDHCAAGVCTGTRPDREPELVSSLRTFGAQGSVGVVLTDGRAVLMNDYTSMNRRVFAVLDTVTPRPHVQTWTEQAGLFGPNVWRASALGDRYFIVENQLSFAPTSQALYRVEPDGSVSSPVALPIGNQGQSYAFFGTTAYAADWNTFRVIDLDDDTAPIVQTFTRSALDVELDSARHRLYLGTPTGVDILDVSVPTTPVLVGSLPCGSGSQWAQLAFDAGARLIVQNGISGGVRQSRCVFDADTLALLDGPVDDTSGLIATHPLGVLRQDVSGVELASYADPTYPTVLASLTLLNQGLTSVGPNALVFRNSGDSVLHLIGITNSPTPRFDEVVGLGQTSLGVLLPHEQTVWSLSNESVQVIDLANPAAPQFTATARAGDGYASVLHAQIGDVAHDVVTGFETLTTQQSVNLSSFDVTVPEAPTTRPMRRVADPLCPGTLGTSYLDIKTRYLIALNDHQLLLGLVDYSTCETPGDSLLEIYDLAHTSPLGEPLPPDATLGLPFSPSNNTRATFDAATRRLLLAEGSGTEGTLIDLTSMAAPALLGRLTFPDPIGGYTGLRGDRIVMVYGGEVRAYRLEPEAATLIGSVPTVRAVRGILGFDGEIAAFVGNTAISFYEVGATSVTLVHTVPLALPAERAAVEGDHLIVGSRYGLNVVYPPCPP